MKALVYGGPGIRRWEEVPDPQISEPEDAIVRVDAVTICGTDLHILQGDVSSVDVGGCSATRRSARWSKSARWSGTLGSRPGVDLVHQLLRPLLVLQGGSLQPMPGRRRLGARHLIDATQAESLRVPFADRSMHVLPAEASERSGRRSRRHPPHVVRGENLEWRGGGR